MQDEEPTMGSIAYVLVFEGFADWEPALAMCEIRKQPGFDVRTVGLTKQPVVSMGGMSVIPDVDVGEVNTEEACVFIFPGGDMWESQTPQSVAELLPRIGERGVPVAAICGATVALARAGILDTVHHTSNTLSYLEAMAPGYRGQASYRDELAVTDGITITASGAGYVEFAREILNVLGIYRGGMLDAWFDLFKHGVVPEGPG